MFFFGTLMDLDLLALVLGRRPDTAQREVAFLRGQRRVFVAGKPYPMLVPQQGGRVEGLLVNGLSDADVERLAYYEGWEYVTDPVTVRTLAGREVATEMFTASSGVLPDSTRDWKLDLWQRKYKPEALVQVAQTMARYGRF
ncbi:hypothetical protein A6A04_16595 [Paramagnetospirillum marisnigri]|uniref:Putative gamma-glutamylcyclotransferase n=2 Tax=Paramagnetospirillum marisnigri TaxID=1285242 RepID=A0A178MQD7_9PROT|nr:hypothetical protein A6A04_16595 [Paramagnetospirillum marisnigri]